MEKIENGSQCDPRLTKEGEIADIKRHRQEATYSRFLGIKSIYLIRLIKLNEV